MKTLAEMMGEWEKYPDGSGLNQTCAEHNSTMQALKEAVELVKEVRDCGAHRHNDAEDWLRKYGFEEK